MIKKNHCNDKYIITYKYSRVNKYIGMLNVGTLPIPICIVILCKYLASYKINFFRINYP